MRNAPQHFPQAIPVAIQLRLGGAAPVIVQHALTTLLPAIGEPCETLLRFGGGEYIMQQLVVQDHVIHCDEQQAPLRATLILQLARETMSDLT